MSVKIGLPRGEHAWVGSEIIATNILRHVLRGSRRLRYLRNVGKQFLRLMSWDRWLLRGISSQRKVVGGISICDILIAAFECVQQCQSMFG